MSTTTTEISQTLKACLSGLAQGGSEVDLVNEDTNLFDVGIDSMNMTELVLRIEEHFGLMLMPEELSADLFTRYSRLVDFVQRKLTHE
ncbi:acyl carrier protein [Roseateles flavus]|uniref:Acyl carrier protein n=1 Tax=Roseateles flavus TaxID=3149041 RepID=A0ABV0GCH2_9BURK